MARDLIPRRSHRRDYWEPAASRTAEHIASRLLPLLTPWAGPPALFLAAVGTHVLWGTSDAAPWAAAGLTLVTVGLTFLAHVSTHARGPVGRAYATGTAGGAMAWLTVATITGPASHPTLDLLILFGGAGALAWSIRRGVHASDGGGGEVSRVGKRWPGLAAMLGLDGSKWRTRAQDQHRVEGVVQLVPGQHTPDDVANQRGRIASALQVSPAGVRVMADPDNNSRALVTVVAKDLLRTETLWTGPSRPGKSVADLVRLGRYEDAKLAELVLPGMHLLIGGTTGAGKTGGVRVLLTELWSRHDVVCWGIDIIKGEQTFAGAMAGLDWVATTRAEAETMLEALPAVIKARTTYLARLPQPLEKWEPGCGIPLLVVVVEEAPQLIRDSKRFVEATQTARSAGVVLVVCVQSARWTSIPTDARSNFGGRLCFGTTEDADARFVLEDLVDAGADPSRWGIKQPGCAYYTGPGVDDTRAVVPLRTPKITLAQVAQATRMAAGRLLDEATVAAGGEAYATRTRGADVAAAQPTTGKASPGVQVVDEHAETETDEEAMLRLSTAEQARLLLAEAGITDPEPDLRVDPDDEIQPAPATLEFVAPAGRQVSPETSPRSVPGSAGRVPGSTRSSTGWSVRA